MQRSQRCASHQYNEGASWTATKTFVLGLAGSSKVHGMPRARASSTDSESAFVSVAVVSEDEESFKKHPGESPRSCALGSL